MFVTRHTQAIHTSSLPRYSDKYPANLYFPKLDFTGHVSGLRLAEVAINCPGTSEDNSNTPLDPKIMII